jgi:ferric-dicitrate binding protein FerR (iron transport regulator)
MSDERIWELMARKFASEASVDELEELEQLLRTHPELHFSIQALTDLWQHKPPADDQLTEAGYRQHIERMQQMGIPIGQQTEENDYLLQGSRARPGRRRALVFAIAASLVLITATAGFFYSKPTTGQQPGDIAKVVSPSEISVKNGSKTRIKLPDGTQVWLNAGSRLTYDKDFGNRLREVTLTGEGFFDVVRNEQKPFIIHTIKMDVKVLGTRFNVKSYPNDKTTEASLIHGSIEVSLKDRPAEKIILKPNEKIVVANADTAQQQLIVHNTPKEHTDPLVAIKHLTYQQTDSTIVETSWVDNKLAFSDEAFSELAPKLERWYGVSIQFKEESLKNLRFTGTFKDETIAEVMQGLTITAPFNYTFKGKTITITR